MGNESSQERRARTSSSSSSASTEKPKSTIIPKSLHNTTTNHATKNVPDLTFWGDGDMFKLLCKASSEQEGWMKSTKAMEIPYIGVVVQVTTQQRNPNGSYSCAEALTFVPGSKIQEIKDETGKVIERNLIHRA